MKQTDVLLEKLEAERNSRQEEERKLREAESNRSAVHNSDMKFAMIGRASIIVATWWLA